MTMLDSQSTPDGVRLLSHRPSVLYKVEHLATEPVEGDIAVEGLVPVSYTHLTLPTILRV